MNPRAKDAPITDNLRLTTYESYDQIPILYKNEENWPVILLQLQLDKAAYQKCKIEIMT